MNWNYPYPPKYSAHGLQIIVFGSRQRTNITFLNMLYHAFKITAHSRSYKTEQPNTQQLYVISAEFGATLLLQSFSSLTTSDNFDPFLFDLKIPQKNWMIRGRLIQKRKDGIWLTCEKIANAQERERIDGDEDNTKTEVLFTQRAVRLYIKTSLTHGLKNHSWKTISTRVRPSRLYNVPLLLKI